MEISITVNVATVLEILDGRPALRPGNRNEVNLVRLLKKAGSTISGAASYESRPIPWESRLKDRRDDAVIEAPSQQMKDISKLMNKLSIQEKISLVKLMHLDNHLTMAGV